MEAFLQHPWHFQNVIAYLNSKETARLIFASKQLILQREHIREFEMQADHHFPLEYINQLSGLKNMCTSAKNCQTFEFL